MHLATRLALIAVFGFGVTACKKEEKGKKDEPAAKGKDKDKDKEAGKGTIGSPKDGTAIAKDDGPAPPAEAAKAMQGFNATAIKATGGSLGGVATGGVGGAGITSTFGGMFGGGASAAGLSAKGVAAPGAPADKSRAEDPGEPTDGEAMDDKADQPVADEEPMGGGSNPFANITFPPPGEKGGDCQAVADRIITIVKLMLEEQLKGMSPEEREMTEGMMKEMVNEKMGKEFVTMCETQKWPQELKDCALTAETGDALQACEQYVTEEMKQGGGSDSTGSTSEDYQPPQQEPAPAWAGGSTCPDVGKRLRALYEHSMGDTAAWPEESKKDVEKSMVDAEKQMSDACTEGAWNEAVRTCLVGATTIDATQECWSKM